MKLPPAQNAYVLDENDGNEKESKIAPGKIVNNANSKPPGRQVSETDLYLLGAIEKLVFRVDFMEKRLRRVEEMMYYAIAGNRVDQGVHQHNWKVKWLISCRTVLTKHLNQLLRQNLTLIAPLPKSMRK